GRKRCRRRGAGRVQLGVALGLLGVALRLFRVTLGLLLGLLLHQLLRDFGALGLFLPGLLRGFRILLGLLAHQLGEALLLGHSLPLLLPVTLISEAGFPVLVGHLLRCHLRRTLHRRRKRLTLSGLILRGRSAILRTLDFGPLVGDGRG